MNYTSKKQQPIFHKVDKNRETLEELIFEQRKNNLNIF